MCQVECDVLEGLTPSERVARITAASGGTEEVSASAQLFGDRSLAVARIGERDDLVLIELPRESASGSWRLWVRADQIREARVGA